MVITNTDIRDGQPSHVGDRKAFEVMTSTWPLGTLGSVSFLLAATLYQKRQVLEYRLGDKWYTLFSNRPRLLNTICLYIHIYSILRNILKFDFTIVGNGYSSLEHQVLWVQPCLVFVIRFIYILWMYIDSSDVCVWGISKKYFQPS